MEDIYIRLALIAAYMKTDPVYSFILDSVSLMVVSIFGAMTDLMNSKEELTARKTVGSFLSAVGVAVLVKVVNEDAGATTPSMIAIGYIGGYKSKWFIEQCSVKVKNVIKKISK